MPVTKTYEKIDTSNIQGSIWPRLPRFYESYIFFKITNVDKFKTDLRSIVDSTITTGEQCLKNWTDLNELNEAAPRPAVSEADKAKYKGGVNIAFTHKGLLKLKISPSLETQFDPEDPDGYSTNNINDGLFEKGMYEDLVFEGADEPAKLLPEFKPPHDHNPADGDNWRVDGVFIVAAGTSKDRGRKVADIREAFDADDSNEHSIEIKFRKDGQLRPGEHRGKEHFGYEDHISQPHIAGLDPEPKAGEPQACPPGYIFVKHEGDPRKDTTPEWSKDGSFLVFRQLDQKVPEFEEFVKTSAEKIDNYKGNDAKLGAHLMGRWKSGCPVAKSVDVDNKDYAFDNDFDFRPKKSIKGCPFAAHVRKMRPRADKKDDVGTEDDGDDTPIPEPDSDEEDEGQREDASVILRRGITYGPELSEEEIAQGKTLKQRGIYFTCYQSDIRDGFNFLMTRWASNAVFPEEKLKCGRDGPGMDPFINQRQRMDHPEGHISLYDGANADRTTKLDLGYSHWVDQKGGEYFFTPSIKALKEDFTVV